MTFAKDDLIDALRVRYDHYSAQALFDMARERAGLADKPALDPSELRAWREGLVAVGDRVGSVLERIDDMLATAGHAPAKGEPSAKGGKAAAKAEAEAAEPAKSEPAKAQPKSEPAKAESKSEPAKAESKSEPAKAESKSEPAKHDAKASPKAAVTKPIETTIVLTGVKAGEGDQVLVCGATAALGDWDPARARPMTKAGDEWRVVVEVAAESELEFKFLRRAADGATTWEGGDDRRAPAAPRIEAVWR